jgi:hypothetical protein
MKDNIRYIFLIFLMFFTYGSFAINGRVIDKKGDPISSAKIVFTDAKDISKIYIAYSDTNGFYNLDIPVMTLRSESDKQYTFFDIYPNPFYNACIIPFYLNKTGNCYVFIYNVMGQKVRTLVDRNTSAGLHQIVWNGTTDMNQRVAPGIYFAYMHFEGRTTTQKIIMRTSNDSPVFPDGVPYIPLVDTSNMIKYNVNITSNYTLPFSIGNFTIIDANNTNFILFKKLALPFKVSGKYLSINNGDNTYDTIFVNGINLGVGKPGTFPGEMSATSEDYRKWFIQMSDVGFNVIRVYTMHYPRFYDELAKYNQEHFDKPLYLLHGVWLDEEKPNGNFFSFTQEYDSDVREVVDCLHGNRTLPERPGRASGNYSTNVSQWVLGFIIGREIHPEEVQQTNGINFNTTYYNGYALSMPASTGPHQPTECWLAQRMDKLVIYERQKYGTERPVSFSSWPTLDPIYHETEHSFFSLEDVDSLDFSRLELIDAPAGFFISYHAYPYYPDFITDDPGYLAGSDQYGPNSYIVYLKTLWQHYTKFKYPVIIAEYGVPSSWGNAHSTNSGMNHGGHTYDKQGEYNIRLLQNIDSAFLAGGCLFSWIDEWFKQTWIVNPITCTPDRRPMWHNLASPEENFGLLTFEPDTVVFENYNESFFLGSDIKDVKVATDFQFFYVNINLNDSIKANDSITIAFDTYDDNLGELYLPDGRMLNRRSEFFLTISKDSANLFVTRAYNTYGIYFIKKWWPDTLTDQLFHSIETNGAPWDLVTWKNNIKDDAIQYIGRLSSRDSSSVYSSLDAVVRNKYSYNIRIPWQLLNFTDPSQNRVLADYRITQDSTETRETEGIGIDILFRQSIYSTVRKNWSSWGYINQNTGEFIFPKYKEVPKKSLAIFRDKLKTLNLKPRPQ